MKKSFIYLSLAATLLLWSCKEKQEDQNQKEESIEATSNEETTPSKNSQNKPNTEVSTIKEVELNKAQFAASDIKLGSIEKKNLTDVIKVNGTTELPPQNQAEVTSFISGTITKILVNIGDKVSKGQLLAIADSPEFIKLQEEYLISKNNLEYLELEYKRQQTLRSENVNSEKTYQKTKSELNIEKSRFQSLSNQLILLNTNPNKPSRTLRIVAPISGNIATIPIRIGTNITTDQSLFTLVDNSKIHLDLMVYEKDLPTLKIGQKVSFTLTNINKTEVTATIFSIGKSFEPGTKTVAVHANIDKTNENLIPGLYVNALIHSGKQEVEALPTEAIVKAEGREFIFVKEGADSNEESNHFQRVEVKTGVTELGYTQVTLLQNVPTEGKIVINGAYYLQSHLIKNEGGGGHDH
ncbi:MAG: efflux RND transporter periplasmic adaptor subunit [Flavobacteriaceae bacterium]|jgi:cobalt-zinc-cadmium efflux system membrane fusion protein|nr:efflux RND transporter periplasmic adaptor subunit [Flavobacteriaceae bacterium]